MFPFNSIILRRAFSTTVHELGSELQLSSLKISDSQKFFKLEKLDNLKDVVQAPEGSVVMVDPLAQTRFQQSML